MYNWHQVNTGLILVAVTELSLAVTRHTSYLESGSRGRVMRKECSRQAQHVCLSSSQHTLNSCPVTISEHILCACSQCKPRQIMEPYVRVLWSVFMYSLWFLFCNVTRLSCVAVLIMREQCLIRRMKCFRSNFIKNSICLYKHDLIRSQKHEFPRLYMGHS